MIKNYPTPTNNVDNRINEPSYTFRALQYIAHIVHIQSGSIEKRSPLVAPSSETQGQIVGARESLNRRENMAQEKSKER